MQEQSKLSGRSVTEMERPETSVNVLVYEETFEDSDNEGLGESLKVLHQEGIGDRPIDGDLVGDDPSSSNQSTFLTQWSPSLDS